MNSSGRASLCKGAGLVPGLTAEIRLSASPPCTFRRSLRLFRIPATSPTMNIAALRARAMRRTRRSGSRGLPGPSTITGGLSDTAPAGSASSWLRAAHNPKFRVDREQRRAWVGGDSDNGRVCLDAANPERFSAFARSKGVVRPSACTRRGIFCYPRRPKRRYRPCSRLESGECPFERLPRGAGSRDRHAEVTLASQKRR